MHGTHTHTQECCVCVLPTTCWKCIATLYACNINAVLSLCPQRLVGIADSENALTHKQIVETVKSVNANLLRQRKGSADVRKQVGKCVLVAVDVLQPLSCPACECS